MRRPIVLTLNPSFAACVWQNGSTGGTFITLLQNGVSADWVTGGSIPLGGASTFLAPLAIVESADIIDASDNSVVLVGRGSAVVASITPTGVEFGTVANFTVGVSVDNHVVALAGGFAISYYDTNSTGAFMLFTTVGTTTRFTISFTPAIVYASDHISHALVRVSDAAYALAFPDDDAAVATDDMEQNGFPLGVVIAVWNKAQASVTLYGRGSGSGGAVGLPRPWTQPYVRTHYFLSASPVRSFTATQGGTVVIAAADRSVGDAIRALTVEVYASYTGASVSGINVEFSDLASVTASGATVGYRTLSLTPIVVSASEVRFLLSHSDPSAAGAIAGSIFSVALADAAVTVITRGLLLSAALPEADPTSYAELNWVSAAPLASGRVMVVTVASLSDVGVTLGNVTIVEHMRPAFGIATGSASCASAGSVSTASSGIVTNVAWLPGSAAASGAAGRVAYATTRGGMLSSASSVYTPAGGTPGAAGVAVNVARDSIVGIVLDAASVALSPAAALA